MYRKKPVVIEAMQFTIENKDKVFWWANEGKRHVSPTFNENGEPTLTISTLEGDMIASLGDYVIKGIQGEFYPCKPDIFEQTYESVNLDSPTS